jgi:hypothetical protein
MMSLEKWDAYSTCCVMSLVTRSPPSARITQTVIVLWRELRVAVAGMVDLLAAGWVRVDEAILHPFRKK